LHDRLSVLNEQYRQILSSALLFEMRDPELKDITITRVKLTPDFQFADVRFTLYDDEKSPEKTLRALERARGMLKRILSGQINLRRAPELRFHYDEDIAAERRIGEILENLDIPPEEAT